MRTRRTVGLVALACTAVVFSPRAVQADDMHTQVLDTIAEFKKTDPSLLKFFTSAVGYAVLPTIGKGAVGIGGAHGTGELLVAHSGKAIGKVSLTQITIGLALGGQAYSEIIFFENQKTLDAFKKNEFTFAAQATAVALTAGAATNVPYKDGVAVFTHSKGGLMG